MTSYSVTEAANKRPCCHIWPKLTAKVQRARLGNFSWYTTDNVDNLSFICHKTTFILIKSSKYMYLVIKQPILTLFIHLSIKIIWLVQSFIYNVFTTQKCLFFHIFHISQMFIWNRFSPFFYPKSCLMT